MANSLIYTDNNTVQELAVGSTIALGNVVRRFGKHIALNGNAITLCGTGYYKVDANITITATNAGTVTITLLKDGVAYATRNVSVAVGDVVVVPMDVVLRDYQCYNNNITFTLNGTAENVTDMSVVVTKE